MRDNSENMSILSETECWDLLDSVPVGRLVTSVDGQPDIFPVNFVVRDRAILIRTAVGTKLVSAVINEGVLFEVDQHDEAEGWSVIVKGAARTLKNEAQLREADEAGLLSWTSSAKDHVLAIRPIRVTGRRYVFTHDAKRGAPA